MEGPTVLICTDDRIEGIGLVAALQPQFVAVVIIGPSDRWAAELQSQSTGIVLLDYSAEMTTKQVRAIAQDNPELRLVLIGRNIPIEFAYQAARAGASGVVRRPCAVEELTACIQGVAVHGTWFDDTLMKSLLSAREVSLSRRESQLVEALAHGLKNKEIASSLGISEGTVKVYMSKLFDKLCVKDRFELALYGLRNMTQGVERGEKILLPALPGTRERSFMRTDP